MSPLSILSVCPALAWPPTNGQRLRNWMVLRALAASGHRIKVLAFAEPGERAEAMEGIAEIQGISHQLAKQSSHPDYMRRLSHLFTREPYSVSRFRSRAMREAIARCLLSERVDVVICEACLTVVNLPERLPVPFIVDNHNLEHVLLERYARMERHAAKRLYVLEESRKMRSWECAVNARARLSLTCSALDGSLLASRCPEARVKVVPNAIDTDRYLPQAGDEHTVLFSGGMDWYPNQQAAEFFATRVFPEIREKAPRAEFVVAGRAPAPWLQRRLAGIPGVRLTGTVADMRAEIARAAVCVAPLQVGSGTRLKILEAAAMGKAIVSTRLGAEGLEFAEGREIVIADEPGAFAAGVAALLGDSARRGELGAAARRRVERSYSLPVARQCLEEALREIGPRRANSKEEPGFEIAAPGARNEHA